MDLGIINIEAKIKEEAFAAAAIDGSCVVSAFEMWQKLVTF